MQHYLKQKLLLPQALQTTTELTFNGDNNISTLTKKTAAVTTTTRAKIAVTVTTKNAAEQRNANSEGHEYRKGEQRR